MPGVPRATYMPFPFHIVQSTNKILIVYEFASAQRTIHLDEVPATYPIDTWMGGSGPAGAVDEHARGADAVRASVETTNFTSKTDYLAGFSSREVLDLGGEDGAPPYRADENLRLVERFTPVGPNTIDWSVTVENPANWEQPWTFAMPLTRDDAQPWVFEYACHEGNYGIANILSGARARERAAQEAGER